MRQLMIICLSLFVLAGCAASVKGPRVKGSVEVDGGSKNNNSGDFCPPGQAKKGRC